MDKELGVFAFNPSFSFQSANSLTEGLKAVQGNKFLEHLVITDGGDVVYDSNKPKETVDRLAGKLFLGANPFEPQIL